MEVRRKARRKSPARIKGQRTIAAKLEAQRQALDQLARQNVARRVRDEPSKKR